MRGTALLLVLLLSACKGGDAKLGESCSISVPCEAPLVCDPVKKLCATRTARDASGTVIDAFSWSDGQRFDDGPSASGDGATRDRGTTPPPDSASSLPEAGCKAPKQACGTSCVDVQVHAGHCGKCNNPCGANAYCSAGSCRCTGVWLNCDGVFSTNGCECATSCDGKACTAGTCDPKKAGDCKSTFKYCSSTDRTCKPCTSGWENCDQLDSCECKITSATCTAGKCVY
ncbi:MAG: hypothetical protein IT371_23500 [Deltaproteobacteria bacterium]|nr:hypothetical protein [Deltaproteobacteria bacterium]